MENKIKLKNIRVYAYHGCLEEEAQIGSDYIVNLTVTADLEKPSITDKLADTVDYVTLHNIVREEMAIRANLLEHVAKRIIDAVLNRIENIKSLKVSVAKRNPPIGGDVTEVSVSMKASR